MLAGIIDEDDPRLKINTLEIEHSFIASKFLKVGDGIKQGED